MALIRGDRPTLLLGLLHGLGLLAWSAHADAEGNDSVPALKSSSLEEGMPWTVDARMEHAPHSIPKDAPHVVIHGPRPFGVSERPRWVLFLHGWRGCARRLMSGGPTACVSRGDTGLGWDLARKHDAAGIPSILIIPQLGWLSRNADAGRFTEPNFVMGFFDELFSRVLSRPLGGPRSLESMGPATMVAHSAGYQTALALLESPLGERIHDVVLLDAFYNGRPLFERWLRETGPPDARLITIHTGHGKPYEQSLEMLRKAQARWGKNFAVSTSIEELPAVLQGKAKLFVMRSPFPHGALPKAHLEDILRALNAKPRQAGTSSLRIHVPGARVSRSGAIFVPFGAFVVPCGVPG